MRINMLQIDWETYPVKSSSLSLSGTFITVDGRTTEAVEVDDGTGEAPELSSSSNHFLGRSGLQLQM